MCFRMNFRSGELIKVNQLVYSVIPVLSFKLLEIEDKLRGDGVLPSLSELRPLFRCVLCVRCALGLCAGIGPVVVWPGETRMGCCSGLNR